MMMDYKCKICGGTLAFDDGSTIAECEYCGTKQTLPKLTDSSRNFLYDRSNQYDRANHYRRNNEFDKAEGIYEQLLNEDETDAEAYWSLVLCHYGIEYVEDPTSHKRLPTINRAQYTSIFSDENYKKALEYADVSQRALYEKEAKVIDNIQKGILAISEKEDPFDVFICYKETDEKGSRTRDSVLAAELYQELTKEGLKTFFARVTLEDKLGEAYEPYIFAALNSAKVMVVVGTKAEYLQSVWVKNEWSRFLGLIKSGAKKTLIPAYKNMDPYDMPEEFSHLQAQDMEKLGFSQDLVRGIRKLVGPEKETENKNATNLNLLLKEINTLRSQVNEKKYSAHSNGNTEFYVFMKRAMIALEDGDFIEADNFYEKALNVDPESGEAYLGKLMVTLRVKSRGELSELESPFSNNKYYKKAIRYGDDELVAELSEYLNIIYKRRTNLKNNETYSKACALMAIDYINDYENAIVLFEKLDDYKDSIEKKEKCKEHISKLLKNRDEDIKKGNEILESRLKKLDEDKKIGFPYITIGFCAFLYYVLEWRFWAFWWFVFIMIIKFSEKNKISDCITLLKDCDFVVCPKGKFSMGSLPNEIGHSTSERMHTVSISNTFYISKFPVTQAFYKKYKNTTTTTNNNTDKVFFFFQGDDNPADNIDWFKAQEFIKHLNDNYSLACPPGYEFALPTEAQWEYACRAGETTSLNNGKNITLESGNCYNLDEVGWYGENSDNRTHEVGLKKPNAWGIYDMHGNVFEWCEDYWDGGKYKDGYIDENGCFVDPTGPASGTNRVARGGSWHNNPKCCRSAFRLDNSPKVTDEMGALFGFRIALVPKNLNKKKQD